MLMLHAQPRTMVGRKVGILRQEGHLPAVVYGEGGESLSISVSKKDFDKVFRQSGETTLVDLQVENNHYNVLIKDVMHDPLNGRPIHVDFFRVPMDEEIEVEISLEFEGESPAVKSGAILVKVMHKIGVKAIPAKLPSHLSVDLALLEKIGDKFTAQDLQLPDGVSLVGDTDEVIALVEELAKEEEAPVAQEGVDFSKIEVVKKGKEEVSDETESSEKETE